MEAGKFGGQSDILGSLARADVWRTGDRQQAISFLVETAAENLRVDRVSVWLYDQSRSQIVCQDLFNAASGTHETAAPLLREKYPSYFAAMDESRVIDASNASSDPRTSELAVGYLDGNQIGAMLDAPIVVGGECLGIICHEHVGTTREWSPKELSFAGTLGDYVGLAIAVFEHRRAESQLRHRDEQLQRTLRSAKMGLWDIDLATGCVWSSQHVGPLLGLDETWQGDTEDFLSRLHPDDRPGIEQTMRLAVSGGSDGFLVEYRVIWPNKEVHWLEGQWFVIRDEAGKATQITGTLVNMDHRRQMEEQVRHSSRMTDMGRLASSIAHDFNNLLTVVTCSAALLERRLGEPDAQKQSEITDIMEATGRASGLVSQLLAFGRKRAIKPASMDFNALVADLRGIIERLAGAEVDIVIVPTAAPSYVFADPGQMDQILVNLVVNAKDAMEARGRIEISLSHELRVAGLSTDQANSPFLVVRVRDTGPGIDPELLKHIFEPFFTTKDDRGSGLGLATSYGIARQAGGDLFVEQSTREGTTFALMLPLLAPES